MIKLGNQKVDLCKGSTLIKKAYRGSSLIYNRTNHIELDYLESTGTQWIDTGFLSSQLYDKSLYIKMKTTGGTSSYAYNGAYHISGTGLTIQFGLIATSDTLCRSTSNHFDPSYLNVANLQKSEYTELMMTPTEYWVNGELKAKHEQTSADKILETNNKFLIFGRTQYNQANSIAPMIISEFWIKDKDGKFVQHLIPVLDKDFVACMYDKVSGKYFYNQGSGEFKWRLPNQLDYLESDGAQYLNLDYIPTAETGLHIKVSTVGQGDMIVCGSRNDSTTHTRLFLSSTYSSSNKPVPFISIGRGTYMYLQLDGSLTASNSNLTVPVNTVYEQYTNYKKSKVTRFIDSTRDITSVTIPELTFTPNQPLYLFAGNIAGVANYSYKGKIYSCEITEGDKIIMYLIPVLDENLTPCMYDLVSKKYFYNQGDGQFKGCFEDGSQVVSYLSATGTQWIDTGVIPLMGDELELKNVQCKKKSSGMQSVFSAGTGNYQTILLVADGTYSDRASFYKYFASGGAKNINPPNYLNDLTNIKITGDGSVYYNDNFIIQSPPEGVVNTTLRLFRRANDSQPMTGDIGTVSIKRGGKYVQYLIPVIKVDGTACMYDLISKKYLTNKGTGSFTFSAEPTNLFKPATEKHVEGYLSTNNNGTIANSTLTDTFYIACKPNTTYKIERTSYAQADQVWRAASSSVEPYIGMQISNMVGGLTNDLSLTITTKSTDKYLMFSEGYTRSVNDLSKFKVTIIGG